MTQRSSCGIYEALWLAKLHQANVGALYLHVPFCARKCSYCDFASWATDAEDPSIAAYLQALDRLLLQAEDAGLLEACKTAYVGGGTPTLAGTRLPLLVEAIRRATPSVYELTCEANPDSLEDRLLDGLATNGCTRISLGVQSLDDTELRLLGRIHTAGQARNRIRAAVSTGLDVSCDLMCAIPGQTDSSWQASLEGVLASGVSHVSIYPLQIEDDTPFGERYGDEVPPWNDSAVQASRMLRAHDALAAHGYRRYEVASYARDGKACAHNVAYWTAVPYLGIGTNASSMLTREAYRCLRTVAHQLPELGEGACRVRLTCTDSRYDMTMARSWDDLSFNFEVLTEQQAAAEDLMLAMRMVEGVGPGLLSHARQVLGPHAVDEVLQACRARGLVSERSDGTWAPTDQGWLLGNELYGDLWALAPGEVETHVVRGARR